MANDEALPLPATPEKAIEVFRDDLRGAENYLRTLAVNDATALKFRISALLARLGLRVDHVETHLKAALAGETVGALQDPQTPAAVEQQAPAGSNSSL